MSKPATLNRAWASVCCWQPWLICVIFNTANMSVFFFPPNDSVLFFFFPLWLCFWLYLPSVWKPGLYICNPAKLPRVEYFNNCYRCVVTGAVNIGWHSCPLLVSWLCAAVLDGIWGDKIYHTYSVYGSLKTEECFCCGLCDKEEKKKLNPTKRHIPDRIMLVNTSKVMLIWFSQYTQIKELKTDLGSLFFNLPSNIVRANLKKTVPL